MTELSAENGAKNQHLRLFYLFNVTISECASLKKEDQTIQLLLRVLDGLAEGGRWG